MNRLGCIAFLMVCWLTGFTQGVRIEKQPGWVTSVPYSEKTPDSSATSGGYYYLLVDQQHHVDKGETFWRFAIKVLSDKGLEMASGIETSFDPSYSTLAFHSIMIKRLGKIIDKLDRRKIDVLRREQNLERQVYDGELSAVINLEGVQAGDIVEYSYSVRGENPVFKGKFSNRLYTSFSDPTGKIYYSVTSSQNRPVQINYLNTNVRFQSRQTGNFLTHFLEMENIPAVIGDDNTPGWYEEYGRVEFSEFKSWEELRGWARELFIPEEKPDPGLEEKIRKIRAVGTPEMQVRKSIEFVQDEIRYLSFSGGINSYKPHPPGQVFTQRFGDCKDKSFLLSYILGKLGVESHPALVSTTYGKTMKGRLPAPGLFDHCIVTMRFKDSVYWIDPTISFQRGRLAVRTVPTYYQALVMGDRTGGLEVIPFGLKRSAIRIEEIYTVAKVGTTARLRVNTVYIADEADNVRHQRQASSLDEIGKTYLNFYATDFPTISATAPVRFEDDPESNTVTTHELYTIGSFWKFDSAAHRYSADTYARTLANYLKSPDTKIRTAPYSVAHPVDVSHVIKIELPEPWTIKDDAKKIETGVFRFQSSTVYHDKKVRLAYAYQTKDEFVPVSGIKEHLEKTTESRNELSFQLTYSTHPVAASPMGWKILVGVVVAAFVFAILKRRAS